MVRNISYQPWGNVLSNTEESGASTLDPSHKFTGQILDDSTDLYYYGARYYDPSLKRFISPDTIVQDPYDPQSLNRYAYCRNNPLIYRDPSGHEFEGIISDMYTYLNGYEAGYKYNRDERNIFSQPYMYQMGYLEGYGNALSKNTGMVATAARFLGSTDVDRTTDVAIGNFGKIFSETWEQLRNDVAQLGDPEFTLTKVDLEQMSYMVMAFSTPLKIKGTGNAVIGKLEDLKNISSKENTLLKHLPDLGSPKSNWYQNARALRIEMSKGLPIRDASINSITGQLTKNSGFLKAERNLMMNHGWIYDPLKGFWMPPK